MTDDRQSPWDKWVAKNLSTPQQRIRWWLVLWGFCLIVAPLMVMDGHDRIGTRIFIIGAVAGWIPPFIIFVRLRQQADKPTNQRDQ